MPPARQPYQGIMKDVLRNFRRAGLLAGKQQQLSDVPPQPFITAQQMAVFFINFLFPDVGGRIHFCMFGSFINHSAASSFFCLK